MIRVESLQVQTYFIWKGDFVSISLDTGSSFTLSAERQKAVEENMN